ncbi:class I SAM-dependent methyltransferase [Catelliglobosispora koreensis]|uniref:class I SAM-dependent methyltransferase n=1 Tax=Catelliglobosispora koreensis TaxID=129052 RepID=UPI000688B315|nr:class I SAM-dependent methyltransferase [Catelliglobosispora koreensis]
MIYSNARLARAYAVDRPPIHALALASVAMPHVELALDIGCGAGLSAHALLPYASHVIGVDPAPTMLAAARPADRLSLLVARAEALPFPDNSFGLVTAAGSLNYADRSVAVPEILRVLQPGGTFVVYDFSCASLPSWWTAFEERYPSAPGYEMDRLPELSYVDVNVTHPMTLEEFVRYAMSETDTVEGVEEWCRETLRPVIGSSPLEVSFSGYVASRVFGS